MPSCGSLSASRYFHEKCRSDILSAIALSINLKFNSGSLGDVKCCVKGERNIQFSRKLAITFRAVCGVSAFIFCFACNRNAGMVRPVGVSIDAVFVDGAKAGWWQVCTWTVGTQVIHCRIWNKSGLALEDEEFLPYDGGASPAADELKISPDPVFPGPDRIFLSNGRVLLPRSRFGELKKFVDWLNGKTSNPR